MGLEAILFPLFGTTLFMLALMFLPAVVELAHPKDAGPRIIGDSARLATALQVVNIEGDCQLDIGFSWPLAENLKVPNLE